MSIARLVLASTLLFACHGAPKPVASTAKIDSLNVSIPADTSVGQTPFAISTSHFLINGITPGQTEAQVIAILGTGGTKSAREHEEVLSDSVWTLTYSFLTVRFAGREVDEVSCTSDTCSTVDGARIGDSWARVETLYGPGEADPTHTSLRYFGVGCDCGMTFMFYSGKVGSITLWVDES